MKASLCEKLLPAGRIGNDKSPHIQIYVWPCSALSRYVWHMHVVFTVNRPYPFPSCTWKSSPLELRKNTHTCRAINRPST